MPEVTVELTPRNLARIRNGHTIQLKPTQIGGGSTTLRINDELAKRVAAAMKKNKGVKVQLSAQEIEASGLKSVEPSRRSDVPTRRLLSPLWVQSFAMYSRRSSRRVFLPQPSLWDSQSSQHLPPFWRTDMRRPL
jgi:hypothetical protein